MSQQYFIRRGAQVSGPAQAELLEQYAASGKLRPTDEVATSREGPWRAVQQVPLLARHLPAPDPPEDPFADALAAASTLSEAAPAMPQSAAPQRKKKRKPQRKKKARPQGQKKTGQRPAWLDPVIAVGGILVCLMPIGCFMFLEIGSEIGLGSSGWQSVLNILLSLALITVFFYQAGISTITGGVSLALTLCILEDSRNTAADFVTHFISGMLFFAVLWGALLVTVILAVMTTGLISDSLGRLVLGFCCLLTLSLAFRMLRDWYDYEWLTALFVLVVTCAIQAIIGYGSRYILVALLN